MQCAQCVHYCDLYLTPYSPTYIPPIYPQWWILLHIHHLYSLLIFTIDSPWLRIRSVDSVHDVQGALLYVCGAPCWRARNDEYGARCGGGRWLLSIMFWSWLQSWMVAVNMETYKYNSTFSLSEYWRIFISYTNLGFASVCIPVNIRQYSLRLQVLLYTYFTTVARSLHSS